MDNASRPRYLILNGETLPAGEARISPEMNGLYHGSGAFETMLSNRGAIFRFADHVNRLHAGMNYLGLENGTHQNSKRLRKDVDRLLKMNGLENKRARIRIQVSETAAGGYSSLSALRSLTLITADELPDTAGDPVRLVTSPVRVVPSVCRPAAFKLSNMLHYRDAMRRAKREGADDALMYTMDGMIAESAIANIFWLRDGIIRTPSIACDILPGIMRNALLEIIKDEFEERIQVEEGEFGPEELHGADCIWLTNSLRGMWPVVQLDEVSFEAENPVFLSIQKKMLHYIKETSE